MSWSLLWPFTRPKILRVAEEELADAHLDLLNAQTGLDFARSRVAYNQARIKRLQKYVTDKRQANLSPTDTML